MFAALEHGPRTCIGGSAKGIAHQEGWSISYERELFGNASEGHLICESSLPVVMGGGKA